MKNTIELMKEFEKRNNISVAITFCSDGSSSVEEFWDDEVLKESATIEELHSFLKDTQYNIDTTTGRCLSPVQIK